jgi:predicted methyltransferase
LRERHWTERRDPVNVSRMNRKPLIFVLALLGSSYACAASPPPPSEPPPAPVVPAPIASAAPPAPPAAPPEPTPEEKKKAEEAQKLADDRAKMEADAKTELSRWTPEMHAEAKTLAERTYPSLRAGVDAALKGKTVLEYGPGEGWYTEILAPVLAAKGKLLITTTDPNGPADVRSTLYAQRMKAFLDKAPELFGKVEPVVFAPKSPKLDHDGKVDLVIVARGLHGMVTEGSLAQWLSSFHTALKPGGVLGIEQHRAKPDVDAEASAKTGYLPEKWVIQQIEGAGFKLAARSEINANPKDTKDYEQGVWTLPPNYRLGDQDRAKYAAIGESDRMTLRFVKVAKK